MQGMDDATLLAAEIEPDALRWTFDSYGAAIDFIHRTWLSATRDGFGPGTVRWTTQFGDVHLTPGVLTHVVRLVAPGA